MILQGQFSMGTFEQLVLCTDEWPVLAYQPEATLLDQLGKASRKTIDELLLLRNDKGFPFAHYLVNLKVLSSEISPYLLALENSDIDIHGITDDSGNTLALLAFLRAQQAVDRSFDTSAKFTNVYYKNIDFLLNKCSNLNHQNPQTGYTVAHHATLNLNIPAIRKLTDAGADFSLVTTDGWQCDDLALMGSDIRKSPDDYRSYIAIRGENSASQSLSVNKKRAVL